MTTLVDFSDEPKYNIKIVCSQTGIRAVTLRAWERRHEVLIPHRSVNRYRLYSERDVAVLRWVKNRVDSGLPISSAVIELHSLMRTGVFPEAVPTSPSTALVPSGIAPEKYVKRFYQALVTHEEGKAGDIFCEIQSSFGLIAIFQDILTPTLVEIGDAWYRGSIRITTEHFASAFVQGKMLAMYQAYPSRRSAPFIVLGCAPSEQHELGSLMMAVLLRSSGFRVEYLGPDIPLEDLVDYSSYKHPDMIILTASLENSALGLLKMQEKMSKLHPAPVFGFGGAAFITRPELKTRVQGFYLGDSIEQGVSNIRTLLTKERAGQK